MQLIDNTLINEFISSENLPPAYADTITRWYLPLLENLVQSVRTHTRPLLVGINGAQGTGKSTLAKLLTVVMTEQNLQVANLSLDDFYLGSSQRNELAKNVHPLLASRGVPGTHDVDLMAHLLAVMRSGKSDEGNIKLPRFDKAMDEPKPESEWDNQSLPVNVIILEGWFTGAKPEEDEKLAEPVNQLEAQEDPDGSWRRYVNCRLGDYQAVFAALDYLIMLKAPSFDCVYQWRSLQEEKLRVRVGESGKGKIMDAAEIQRFIQHFERLTRHALVTVPEQADLVFHLGEDHQITSMSGAIEP